MRCQEHSAPKEKSMLYVIKNLDNGKYVARTGFKHSYTTKLSKIRFFINNEAAQRERCGNEVVEGLRSN
jgi:hypothetical protein